MIEVELSGAHALEVDASLLAIPVYEEELEAPKGTLAAADAATKGHLLRAAREEEFKAKAGSTFLFHTAGAAKASRLALLGLGKRAGAKGFEPLRMACGGAARTASKVGAGTLCVAVPPGAEAARAAAEGALLGAYRFDRYKSDKKKVAAPAKIVLAVKKGTEKSKELKDAVALARVIAEASWLTRDLVNEPAEVCTPSYLAERALALKEHGLEVQVLGKKEIEKLKMGMFLGVARASAQEPKLVRISHLPKGANAKKAPLVLVGKAITFDSGGLSLKSNENMMDMKTDMAGSATVIGAMRVIAELKPGFPVHALFGACENMPGGRAYKLGDVLTAYNGKTVEITNTDAEGRLVLGDVLSWGVDTLKPAAIVDLATLTGACIVALGHYTVGTWGQGGAAEKVLAAAKAAGEDFWQLPLTEAVKENLKSDIADLRNSGERYGGAIAAALFLRDFVGETPWAHLDIAGPSSLSKEKGYLPKGGTAVGLRTLVELVRAWKPAPAKGARA